MLVLDSQDLSCPQFSGLALSVRSEELLLGPFIADALR